jgi:N-ethylmaleimide reductase
MYAQLWHTGAMSHPDFFDGALPMSASNVNPEQESVTSSGRKPTASRLPEGLTGRSYSEADTKRKIKYA